MCFFIHYYASVCESSHLLSRNSQFFRGRESDPPLAAEVTRVWPDRRRAAEGRWLSKHCVSVLTSSASGKTVNIGYRSWPQQTRSDLRKLATKKKQTGERRCQNRNKEEGFFFFFFFLSTLGTSGYSHSFSHWARL